MADSISGGKGLARVVTWTRYLMYVPVVALFTGSVALVIVGGWGTLGALYRAFFDGTISEKETLVDFITLADLFLLATVLYIIALGLYELFIDDSLPLPQWLVVHDLDDLKEKLTGVVVVVLAVFFLGYVVKATNPMLVMWEGIGVGVMVFALAFFLWAFSRARNHLNQDGPTALVHTVEQALAKDADAAEAVTAEPRPPVAGAPTALADESAT